MSATSAWEWLKQQLVERLGEAQANELWREYWRRRSVDTREARAKKRLRWWHERGNPQDRAWLIKYGYAHWLEKKGDSEPS